MWCETKLVVLNVVSCLAICFSTLMAKGDAPSISKGGTTVDQGYLGSSGGRHISRDDDGGLHLIFTTPSSWVPIPEAGQIVYAQSHNDGVDWTFIGLSQDFAARNPCLALHGNTIHVIYTNWASSRSQANISYLRSIDGGETWSEARDISRQVSVHNDCDYGSMGLDSAGNPHVTFIYPDSHAIYWTASTDGGDGWSTPKPAIFPPPEAGTVSFADGIVDGDAHVHIVFSADGDSLNEKNIYHSFFIDDQWSAPAENVTGYPMDSALCWDVASLIFCQDKRGYLFVSHRNPLKQACGIFVYSRIDWSTNIGVDPQEVWKRPLPVATCVGYHGDLVWPTATLSLDREGILVAFSDGVDIVSRWSEEGELWEDFRTLTPDGGHSFARPNLAYPATAGRADIVWEARHEDECEIRYAVWEWPSAVEPPHLSPRKPEIFELRQNYPNPFNPTTEIEYALPKDCLVRVEIYDLLGQRVVELVNEEQRAGCWTARWDARKFSGGVYFCRLEAGKFVETRKMVLLK